jgi:flagellin
LSAVPGAPPEGDAKRGKKAMNSVLTNTGAMTALQVLNQANKSMGVTQGRISTGLKVATADQNAAVYAMAGVMKADVAGFQTIQEGLGVAESAVSVGRSAAESIGTLLTEMKKKIVQSQDGTQDRTKIQAEIDELKGQVTSIVDTATFNGINYLKSGDAVEVLSSLDRSTTDGANFTVSSAPIGFNKQNLIGGIGAAKEQVVAGGVSLADAVAFKGEIDLTGFVAALSGADADEDNFTITYQDANGTTQNQVINLQTAGLTASTDKTNALINTIRTSFTTIDPTTQVTYDAGTQKLSITDQSGRNYAITRTNLGTDSAAEAYNINLVTKQSGTAVRNSETTYTFDPAELDFDTTGLGGPSEYKAGETFTKITLNQRDGTQLVVDLTDTTSSSSAAMRAVADDATGTTIATAMTTSLNAASTAAGTGVTYTATFDQATNSFKVVDNKGKGVALDFEGAGFGKLGNLTNIDVTTTAGAKSALGRIETMIQDTLGSAAALGSTQTRLSTQKEFLGKLVDAVNTGIGTLVDADMTQESARMQSLQVQQQLAAQALGMANQQPQSLLGLFRG